MRRTLNCRRLNTFWAYSVPPWIFDPVLGFKYNQKPWRGVWIEGRAFSSCSIAGNGNSFGNYGPPDDQFKTADIKVIIVGSSYSQAPGPNRGLINEVLGRQLSEHLGRRVDILNFSRDATGVLSYIDATRKTIDELHPDIVPMLINTPGLIYRRLWRRVMPDDTGNQSFYQMLSPDAKPTDVKLAFAQVRVINEAITPEWCARMDVAKTHSDTATLRADPLTKMLIAEQERQLAEAATPSIAINFWRPDVSFAYNLIVHRNPFNEMIPFETPRYSPYDRDRYSDDPEFVAAIADIKRSGIPVLPIHVVAYPEMSSLNGGFQFEASDVPPLQGRSLVKDLAQELGQPWIELYQYYPASLKANPLKLVNSLEDSHPSPVGVQAMADALEQLLRLNPSTASLFESSATTTTKATTGARAREHDPNKD